MLRRYIGQAPQVSFTSDFHELLEGDLRPGVTLKLRYDPDRLSPPPGYAFADPSWPVFAHAQFLENGVIAARALTANPTTVPDRDAMGQGSMLTGTVEVPTDAQFVELWFCGDMPDGIHWDSDYGKNFWFRFPYADLEVTAAVVQRATSAQFRVEVTSISDVQRVTVRYYDMAGGANPVRREESLARGSLTPAGRRLWGYEKPVAASALIRFKLYYWILDRRFKDDNSGYYYVADRPDLGERVPPPPAALLEAARDWEQRLSSFKKP